MGMTINTNIAALNAQKNLRKTESPLQTAMQRLSSGLRINSAKDDAAGLAIATRMTRSITGLSVAMRNANDGISVAQTAEAAMDEMITAVQRIYELAEQSASYNTSADRDSLNQEVTELVAELNRIVTQTRYNGEQFLNQQFSIDIQVGVEVKETINVSTTNVSPTTMGVSTSYSSSLGASDVAASGFMTYNSAGLGASASLGGVDLGDAISTATDYKNNSLNLINRINQYTASHSVTAFGFGNALVGASAAMTIATADVSSTASSIDPGFLTINGVQVGSFSNSSAASAAIVNMITAINNKSTTTGVSAYGISSVGAVMSAIDSTTRIVLANTNGAGISASLNSAVSGGTIISGVLSSAVMSVAAGANGKIIFNAGLNTTSVTADGSATLSAFGISTTATSVSLTAQSLNSVTVNNVANSNIAILAAKQSLETFVAEKAKLGAKLNRFESTIRNIEGTRLNLTQARSRTLDADFAVETTNFTKTLILQQAGTTILAQANSQPQSVLALLQNLG
ncbi:MAG: flagellin [Nitrospirota bacterium]